MSEPSATPRHRRSLILGALAGRRVGAPAVFLESLRATGTDADVVIFHCDVAPETLAYLGARDALLVPFRYHRWWNGPVHAWRFSLFARYAAEHGAHYDYAMTADLRDVLFQSDPFAAIDTPAVHFFLEPPPGATIAANRYYGKWMRRFVARKFHREYGRCPPTCCGVVLGGSAEMTAYLAALARRLRTVSLLQRHNIGADSAMHNLIAHITHDVPGILGENDGLVATVGLAPEENYTVDAAGYIHAPGGHIPPVVHQYDRHPELFARSKYAALAAAAHVAGSA